MSTFHINHTSKFENKVEILLEPPDGPPENPAESLGPAARWPAPDSPRDPPEARLEAQEGSQLYFQRLEILT